MKSIALPRLLLCCATLVAALAPVSAQDAEARLDALLDAESRDAVDAWPPWGSSLGRERYDALMPDPSPAARAKRARVLRERLRALAAIPSAELSPERALDARLLRHELELERANEAFADWQTPVGPMGGPQQWILQMTERVRYDAPRRRRAFLKRLEQVPAYLAQEIQNLRAGLAAGRTPPRIVLGRVVEQARAHTDEASARDPSGHPLFRPFLAASPAEQAEAKRVLREALIPAFRRFATFLEQTYLPGCRRTIAAQDLPQGRADYALALRRHSTTELSADEIHRIGLDEVARIAREMQEVIARSDFRAPAGERDRFQAFLSYLRADSRFYHRDPESLLDAYRAIAKRVDAELPRLFRRLPRLSYGVRAMSAAIAPSSPTAYYYRGSPESGVAGTFVANTYRLDQRPRYEQVPLTLHEAAPGHHLQIALAQELEGVHPWRRTRGYTAFVEGWALYAERLGLEMGEGPRGLYGDPYDDFGRLTYEMWRAMRLVVDTGIHSKGWTRARAIAFMLERSALSEENVQREVDRYIAWPGQAVAYKLGELAIRRLRREAEQALGEGFDLRAFHDVVLGAGAVPLDVLEDQVRRWIRARARGPH